jgi:hypothetical protein
MIARMFSIKREIGTQLWAARPSVMMNRRQFTSASLPHTVISTTSG